MCEIINVKIFTVFISIFQRAGTDIELISKDYTEASRTSNHQEYWMCEAVFCTVCE